jgi:hypothetical protein
MFQVVGVVDGKNKHLESAPVGISDKCPGDTVFVDVDGVNAQLFREPGVVKRQAEDIRAGTNFGSESGECHYFLVIEGGDEKLIRPEKPFSDSGSYERSYGRRGVFTLEFNINTGFSGYGIEHFPKKRNFFSFSGIQGSEILKIQTMNIPFAAGGSFHPAVVNDHKILVHGKDIQFDPGRSHGKSGTDRQQRVFRCMPAGTPVGEADHGGPPVPIVREGVA